MGAPPPRLTPTINTTNLGESCVPMKRTNLMNVRMGFIGNAWLTYIFLNLSNPV